MATIRYTTLLNSVVSTEGGNGFMTNYFYYSLLVVYTDGTHDIVTGKDRDIKPLLAYLRTPQDEILQLRKEVADLASTINSNSKSLEKAIDTKLAHIIDTLYPIPDVKNMPESEAIEILKSVGLIPLVKNSSSRTHEEDRIIRSIRRNENNYKIVELISACSVPNIVGLTMTDALEKLESSGFVPNVKYLLIKDVEDGIVLSCTRADERTYDVDLEISKCITSNHDEQSMNAIDTPIQDENLKRELVDGLSSAINLFSDNAVRRRLEELYSRTNSDVIKLLLEQPKETIKENSRLILEQLQNQ